MKVIVTNKDGKQVDEIKGVTRIRLLEDGRFIVDGAKSCKYCNQKSEFIYQVPEGYRISGSKD